ncbi:MAG TPA: 50S ribosomal protein L10 [Solirubrobacteraceae bacterium]|nr:50S ribosomal protein L10 [Solirubrobacteraceae bacterium]
MNRDEKAVAIAEIAEQLDGADAIFALDYRGISVAQAAELRTKLRDADASFRVVKNSLTERAADQVGADALKEHLSGPTALTFVRGDIALAAKAVSDYGREIELLPFKGGLMDGEPLDGTALRALARLPSREVLYGQLVGVVASPIGGLVRGLSGLLGGLAGALTDLRMKMESGEIQAAGAAQDAAAPAAQEHASETAEQPDATTSGEPAADTPPPGAEEATDQASADDGGEEQESSEPQPEAAASDDSNEADVAAEAQTQDAATDSTKENE